jgi:hypothetical protein
MAKKKLYDTHPISWEKEKVKISELEMAPNPCFKAIL